MLKRFQAWLGLLLIISAILLYFFLAPYLERLPDNYANTISMDQENQMRAINSDNWQTNQMDVTRLDQTIINMNNKAIIEGSLSVYYQTGELNFEISNRYGVDRINRQNKSGYGNANRTGQFLFPPHTQKMDYTLWDPMYNGPSQVHFEKVDQVSELNVYVFSFIVNGLDETDGYSYLPEIPEKYLAETNGQGMIWVEPVSGIVVNYQDTGASYLVNSTNGARLEQFNRWSNFYLPETIEEQLQAARAFRIRSSLIRMFLPGFLLLVGISLLFAAWIVTRNAEVSP